MWRDGLARLLCDKGSSSLWSSVPDKLCLRFLARGRSDGGIVVAGGCSRGLALASGSSEGAESSGEEEAGEVGVDGWSAAIGKGRFGAILSARTNAGLGYPQMTRV